MGYKFNDVLSVDLKKLNYGLWIIHLIDPVTRYAGAAVKSKYADENHHQNLRQVDLCVWEIWPAESPWCNGTIERHNGVIAEMIAAVLQ